MNSIKIKELHNLIQTLNSSEKRHFKLWAKQFVKERDSILLRLFDVLCQIPKDSVSVMSQVESSPYLPENQDKNWKKTNLPYQMNALYQLVLKTLRDFPRNMIALKLLEMRANINVLTEKGLWDLALKEIKKAQKQAILYSNNIFLLELMLFERRIVRNLTLKNAQQTIKEIDDASHIYLDNITKELKMIALYEKTFISIRDKRTDSPSVIAYENQLNEIFSDKTLGNESFETMWHYCLFKSLLAVQQKDFAQSNVYLRKMIDHFESPHFRQLVVHDFIYQERYLNILINFLNNKIRLQDLSDFDKHVEAIATVENITSSPRIYNLAIHARYYLQTIRWDLEKRDDKIIEMAPKVALDLEKYGNTVFTDRRFSIFYNMGAAFFRSGNYEAASTWISQITSFPISDILKNAQILAQLLLTVILYENYKIGKFKKIVLVKLIITLSRKLKRNKVDSAKIVVVEAIGQLLQKNKPQTEVFQMLKIALSKEDDLAEIRIWVDKQLVNNP